jgi:hypothetical protein
MNSNKKRRDSVGKAELFDAFKDMLPASLGEPYFVNTAIRPYVFVAFYEAKRHEMADGRIINGNQFRLWKPSNGFRATAPLAGIIGIEETDPCVMLCALTCQGTRAHDLKPYGDMIREMMGDIVANRLGSWDEAAS